MLSRHASSTARTLFRVFVQPSLAATRVSHVPMATATPVPIAFRMAPYQVQHRTYKRPTAPERVKPSYIVDEEIRGRIINLVENGEFRPDQRIDAVLRNMNRVTHHLVQLVPPTEQDPIPVCTIKPKSEVQEMELAKLHEKTRKTVDDLTKTIELNWTVADHDLKNWLKRMTEFLEAGRRVEVGIGPKKRAKKATMEQCEALVEKVKEAQASVKGSKQFKESEGHLGGFYTLYFDPSEEAAEIVQAKINGVKKDVSDKKALKQQEKEAEREKHRIRMEKARAAKEQMGLKVDDAESSQPGTESADPAVPKASRYKIKEEQRRQAQEARILEEQQLVRQRAQARPERSRRTGYGQYAAAGRW